ncbi:polysaccharide deacetylase family protein [Nitratifractor sp.]|uniref:polysaccharide deacetylase family protein n=1 Tax=Nitratifractor sp. TaxID=2268144 RepID=UPI0025F757E6|nr:polysaccharide deacetylase family protein [Nitratifractor sp.]
MLHSTPETLSVHMTKKMTMIIEEPVSKSSPLSLLKDRGEDFDSETLPPQNPFAIHCDENQSVQEHVKTVEKPQAKELYLTFDDGPLKGTGNVLKILKEEGVPATMFCVGRHARLHPALFRQELAMPNLLIANHTFSHANGHYSRYYSDTFGLLSDVEHAQIILGGRKYLRLAGRNVWRLPEVARNDRAIMALRGPREVPKYDALAREGYFIYGWDVEWHFNHRNDHPVESPESLAACIDRLYRHGRLARQGKVVLLAHDFMFRSRQTADELRRFIRLMKARGWHFKTINRYSRLRPEPLYVAKYYGKDRKTFAAASNEQPLRPKSRVLPHAVSADTPSKVTAVSASVADRKEKLNFGTHPSQRRTPTQDPRSRQSLLTNAIRHYDAAKVDRLLRRGVSINQPDPFGHTALNTAVRANSLLLVKKLLANGASLNQKDASGSNALQTARRFKRRAIENYLLHFAQKQTTPLPLSRRSQALNTPPIAVIQPKRINPLKMLNQAGGSTPWN